MYICSVVGRQYWHHLRSQPLEYKIFVGFLQIDMPGHWLCDQCLTFHLKPKFHPTMDYLRVWPAWRSAQPYSWLSRLMPGPYTFPQIRASHLMVRMAMNRHLFGSEHGERLDIFSKPFRKGSIQDGWVMYLQKHAL